jgi:hypothetical protein
LIYSGITLAGSNDKLLYQYKGVAPYRQLWLKWHSATAGSAYVYAAAVISEDGRYWSGLLHVGSPHASFVSPNLSFAMQLDAVNAVAFAGFSSDSGAYTASSYDNHFVEFISPLAPATGLEWVSGPGNVNIRKGNPATYSAPILSTGEQSPRVAVLGYSINQAGETLIRRNLQSPDSILHLAFITDTIPGISDTGFYRVRVRVVSVNDIPVSITTGRDTMVFRLAVGNGTLVPARPLFEMHTASWCGECPGLHHELAAVETQEGALVLMHHLRDGLSHAATGQLRSNQVPAVFANRKQLGAKDTSLTELAASLRAEGSSFSLQIKDAEILANNTIRFQTEITCADHFSGELHLFTGLREKSVRGLGQPFDQVLFPIITQDTASPYFGFPSVTEAFLHPRVAWRFLTPYGGDLLGSADYSPAWRFTRNFSTLLPELTQMKIPAVSPYPERDSIVAARYKPFETEMFAVLYTINPDGSRKVLQTALQPLWDFASGLKPTINNSAFKAFPNPAGVEFVVMHPGLPAGMPYSLVNPAGQICRSGVIGRESTAVNVIGLANGVYRFVCANRSVSVLVIP